jgi:tetratricopeptide (TPR) repeat protein
MRYITLFVLLLVTVIFSACAKKVAIKALEPAQIDRMANTKRVAVLDFKHDRIGLSRKIEVDLARFRIDEKQYFQVVSRSDIDAIMRELRLQNSGLINEKTAVKMGELIGADAIVSGDVQPPSKEDSYFYETRARCADRKCKELVYYRVRCMKRVVGLSADLRVVDVAKGDIIYADTLSRHSIFKHCSDDQHPLPSTMIAAESLATQIADDFTYKLTPHYRTFYVSLLDSPDIDYTDEAEKLLEVSLKYIEQGRLNKAQHLLENLIDLTNQKSYVAFYDLGVVKEAQGDYKSAKEYYEYADNLMLEPVEEINEAVLRIDSLISKREKTLQQLQR